MVYANINQRFKGMIRFAPRIQNRNQPDKRAGAKDTTGRRCLSLGLQQLHSEKSGASRRLREWRIV